MNRRNFIKSTAALGLTPIAVNATNIKKPRVLVLGGTGYFGPVLVNELLSNECSVTLLNRGKTNPHLFPDLDRLICDRETEDKSGLARLIADNRQWDWVVDTWQGSSKSVRDTAEILSSRTPHYQYVSTISVYDKWDRIGIDETEPLNPLPDVEESMITNNRYAIRKTYSERVLMQTMPDKCVFFRSHGMRGYPTVEPIYEPYWQVKIARGGDLVVPAGIEYYQITDITSLARFMVHCAKTSQTGPFNVAYPPIRFRDFIREIVEYTNSKVKLHWIPQEFLSEHDVTLMRDKPVGRYRFSVNKAINAGLKNRPIKELIGDQLQGYRDRYPNDDFQFGVEATYVPTSEREQEIIKLWNQRGA